MASNPMRKLQKIRELMMRMVDLDCDFYDLMPAVYRKRPSDDPVCQAWRETQLAVDAAEEAVMDLADFLWDRANRKRARAGDGNPAETPRDNADPAVQSSVK